MKEVKECIYEAIVKGKLKQYNNHNFTHANYKEGDYNLMITIIVSGLSKGQVKLSIVEIEQILQNKNRVYFDLILDIDNDNTTLTRHNGHRIAENINFDDYNSNTANFIYRKYDEYPIQTIFIDMANTLTVLNQIYKTNVIALDKLLYNKKTSEKLTHTYHMSDKIYNAFNDVFTANQ